MKESKYIYPKDLLFWRKIPENKSLDLFNSNYRLCTFSRLISTIPEVTYNLFLEELNDITCLSNYKVRIILPMPANCTTLINQVYHSQWYSLLHKSCKILMDRPDAVLITGCDYDEYNLDNFYHRSVVDIILKIFNQYSLKYNRITWLHGNAFTDDYIKDRISQDYPQTIFYSDFIHQVANIDNEFKPNTFNQNKTNWFLSLNRIARPHRILLCYWWHNNGFRPSYFSCRLGKNGSEEMTNNYQTVDSINELLETFNLPQNENLATDFLKSLPWSIDYKSNNATLPIQQLNSLDKRVIEESACYIVTETHYPIDNNVYHRGWVTEKTFKSFVYGLPFIVLGAAETLHTIKKLGFMSFSSIINEEYDTEYNGVKRMNMVLEEINRLQNIENINEWYHFAQNVYTHNLQHLLNLSGRNYYQMIENFHM
jgi:hypothetical protein